MKRVETTDLSSRAKLYIARKYVYQLALAFVAKGGT